MMQELTLSLLLGFLVTILIPWACLETATYLAHIHHPPKRRPPTKGEVSW